MRLLVVVMVLCPVSAALAQEPPPSANDPYAPPPPPLVAAPLPAPTGPLPPPSVHATLTHSLRRQWTGARVMNGFAGAIGIISGGLSISSSIYVAAAGYPPDLSALSKPPSPSDPAQILSFVSSTSSVFAFGLSAGGLAIRHHVLQKLDADPGRGLFISGTVVGLIGVAAIISSYIVGFSNVGNAHDQSIAVLTTSLGGSAFCNVATTMYAKDGSNMQKIWKSLSTF
jgi:hypothetical protein